MWRVILNKFLIKFWTSFKYKKQVFVLKFERFAPFVWPNKRGFFLKMVHALSTFCKVLNKTTVLITKSYKSSKTVFLNRVVEYCMILFRVPSSSCKKQSIWSLSLNFLIKSLLWCLKLHPNTIMSSTYRNELASKLLRPMDNILWKHFFDMRNLSLPFQMIMSFICKESTKFFVRKWKLIKIRG